MIDRDTGWYATPVSVKAILRTSSGQIVLLRNERGEWELPGGWPDETDSTLTDTLRREVEEELSVAVSSPQLVDAALFEPLIGRKVTLVFYACSSDTTDFRLSTEHTDFLLADPHALPEELPPIYADAVKKALGSVS